MYYLLMRSYGHVMVWILVMLATGCAGAASAGSPGEVRFEVAETKILIRESGAIIIGGREVAKLTKGGKVVDSRGQLLAFVNEDSIRLPGGASLPVKETSDGALYIPSDPQTAADLKPVTSRLRKDDTLAQTQGSRGIPVEGLQNDLSRRVVLLVLVLMKNNLVQ